MLETTRLIHKRIKEMVVHLWTPNAVFGHGFDHAERVYDHAVNMAKLEDIEPLAVGAAAYLMDAGLNITRGRSDHVARSIEIASDAIARIPEFAAYRNVVIECIQYHEAETDVPRNISKEAMILHDSDSLDRMGFTGAAMTIAYGEWVKRRFCSSTDPLCKTRAPELENYTLDYIVYTRTLGSKLLLPRAQREAARKLSETEAFLGKVLARLNQGFVIEHTQARAILSQIFGEPHHAWA
jgi:HD superfamily phosphodiesterase